MSAIPAVVNYVENKKSICTFNVLCTKSDRCEVTKLIKYFPCFQAEELNSIVGNAFRMAYAAQLQKQPSFQDVIASQLDQTQTDKVLWVRFNSIFQLRTFHTQD